MSTTRFNRNKFKELILYVSEKCEPDPSFGNTKLAKVLYYCDFIAYVELGKPITGASYQRLPYGPAPKSLLPVRKEMEQQGEVFLREASRYGYRQIRPIARRRADLREFTGEEIALVDAVIDTLWELDASQVSRLSHKDLGWQLAEEGETIPYETAFIESIEAA
jgi:uncharacterized phage-associated protein